MNLYHALNRGVDKRELFLDSADYVRFIHDLYEFNTTAPAEQTARCLRNKDTSGLRNRTSERLVDIHGWCLMKNHYHLLLSERIEGGLSLFLRKINVGYANYFNIRYERQGTLFQGRTKKIVIETDAHFLYILHYIHLNPLDYHTGSEDWRVRTRGTIRGSNKALSYLRTYRWSSYLDYINVKNFPSLLRTDAFKNSDVFPDYLAAVQEYLGDCEDPSMGNLLLE